MIDKFKEVIETLQNRFSESPLGKQLEDMDFDHIDGTDDRSLDDVPDELYDDNGKQYVLEDGSWVPNNIYVLDKVIYKTDDEGEIYSINGKLRPNARISLRDTVYSTDDHGQIYSANDELKPNINYFLNGSLYATDDFGEIYSIDAKLLPCIPFVLDGEQYITDRNADVYHFDGELQPNTDYRLNNLLFSTDDNGRIYSIDGKLLPSTMYKLNDNYYTDDNGKIFATNHGLLSHTTFELTGHIFTTDDNGNRYMMDGELLTCITYELNGNIYETDGYGRIVSCEAKPVRSPENPRDNEAQQQAGGEDRRPSDQGGHIVGRDINGNSGIGNLVAMDSRINQSDYRRMENDIKTALDEGKQVTTKTDLTYSSDSERPDRITTLTTIDDKNIMYKFDNNLDGSLRNEVPENGKEVVQARLNETGGEISSIKEVYNPVETMVYITYMDEDGTNYRTSVVI